MPAQRMLRLEALALADLVLVLLASTTVFWAVELEKWLRSRSATTGAATAAG